MKLVSGVTADADRGWRSNDSRTYVTAKRDGRTVVFLGRCFDRVTNRGNH